MKKIASIEIGNKKLYINAVLNFMDSVVSNHTTHDFSRYNRLRFALGEILKRRIEKAYPGCDGRIWVDFYLSDAYVEVSVKDKGVPSWDDFSYAKENIADDGNELRNYIFDLWFDGVGMEKLGKDGQRIYIRQKIINPIRFVQPPPYAETEVLDTEITIRPVECEADAIEAIRCIYSEYGYSYSYERLYYVESFMNMIKNGELMSFLAVNNHGQTAGHFALAFSPMYKNMPEISTVVIRKEFRGLKLFSKFMDYSLDLAHKMRFRALMGQPVAFHPMSQKAFIRAGFTATSLLLSYLGADIESEYNKDGAQRLDLCSCVKIIDKDVTTQIFPPVALRDFFKKMYSRLGFEFTISNDYRWYDNTEMKIEDNKSLMVKRIVITHASDDIEAMLADAVKDAIRKKSEMIELMISLRSPSCEYAYQIAKKCGFVFSGAIPGSENDDYLIMQILIKSDRKYDHLVTEGEFEELKNDIIELTGETEGVVRYEF